MRKSPVFLLLAAGLAGAISAASALAEGKSSAQNQKALEEAKALLQKAELTPEGFDAAAAKKAMDQITKGDPKAQQGIQDLSNGILSDMMKSANGNPAQMQQMLMEAQKDPKKFMDRLTPAQREELRRLASEIDQRK